MFSCIPLAIALPALATAVGTAVAVDHEWFRRKQRHNSEADLSRLSNLNRLAATINASRDAKQTLERALTGTLGALGLDRGLVLVETSNGGGWTISKGFSAGATNSLERGSLRDYLLQSGKRWGELMIFSGLENKNIFASWQLEPVFREFREFFFGNDCRSLAVVALSAREEMSGVMILASREPRVFPAAELRLLDSIREQVAMALEYRLLAHEEEQRGEEIESLRRIGEALSGCFDPESQFEILQHELRARLSIHDCWLAFRDVPEGRLEILSGLDAETREAGEPPQVEGLIDHVLSTRSPLMIGRDVQRVARRLGVSSPDSRLRFWCGVPMQFADGSTGLLAAGDFHREEALDRRQFQFLQTLTGEARVSIENARLYQRDQRRARHLTLLNELARRANSITDPRELRLGLCQQIRGAFGCDLVRFEALDRDRRELVIEAQEGCAAEVAQRRSEIGRGLSGAAAETGEPVISNCVRRDARYVALDARVRSSLNLPLKYRDEVFGVLVVESFRENGFSTRDTLALRTLAEQLAIALHNASAFQTAQQEAITDGLTHLKTHRFFMEALEGEWRRAPRSGHPFSIIMMDLDRFKRVNDRYGHAEGDRVLVAVARLLDSRVRRVNPVARFGGDEFSILMPETEADHAEALAERLRVGMSSDPYLASHAVSASFGLANFPAHGATPDELLRVAECGVFLAKHEDGNCVRIASRVSLAEGQEVEKKVLDAYLGVSVKRLFSTGPDAFDQYLTRFEQAVRGAAGQATALMDTVTALAFAIDAKDHYTQGHSQSVSRLAAQIARQMGLREAEIEEIRLAGILHDIGKIGIPETILNKPARLTEDEYDVVKGHVVLGEKILGPLKAKGMVRIRKMVRHHHEYFDGSGYPDGLSGEEIPLGARILTVADCFDTIVSRRAYKEGRSVDDAVGELRRACDTHFDRTLVEAFIQSFAVRQEHAQVRSALLAPAN